MLNEPELGSSRRTPHTAKRQVTLVKDGKEKRFKADSEVETEVNTDMMEEGGTDVVQVTQQREETATLLVVPHLRDKQHKENKWPIVIFSLHQHTFIATSFFSACTDMICGRFQPQNHPDCLYSFLY